MNERKLLDDMYQEINMVDMEQVPLDAEIHFSMAINKIMQLDLDNLDISNHIVQLRIAEAKGHYRQALLAIDRSNQE